MKDFYLALKAALLTISELKHVGWWNNQFDNEKEETAFLYPCVFIHFSEIPYEGVSAGIQQMDMKVTLHFGYEAYDDENLDFFDIKDLIHAKMQGFSYGAFSGMNRTFETIDVNHTNIQDYIMEYTVSGTDSTGHVNNKYTLMKMVTLELETELKIDNDIIRTGVIE